MKKTALPGSREYREVFRRKKGSLTNYLIIIVLFLLALLLSMIGV